MNYLRGRERGLKLKGSASTAIDMQTKLYSHLMPRVAHMDSHAKCYRSILPLGIETVDDKTDFVS